MAVMLLLYFSSLALLGVGAAVLFIVVTRLTEEWGGGKRSEQPARERDSVIEYPVAGGKEMLQADPLPSVATPSGGLQSDPALVLAPTDNSLEIRHLLTFEEELERPFLERLRSSFFSTGQKENTVSQQMDQAETKGFPKLADLETIFQSHLARIPTAPPATIRVGHGGLLKIIVAGEVYERIDEVPHPAVQEAMREAIKLWECSFA